MKKDDENIIEWECHTGLGREWDVATISVETLSSDYVETLGRLFAHLLADDLVYVFDLRGEASTYSPSIAGGSPHFRREYTEKLCALAQVVNQEITKAARLCEREAREKVELEADKKVREKEIRIAIAEQNKISRRMGMTGGKNEEGRRGVATATYDQGTTGRRGLDAVTCR